MSFDYEGSNAGGSGAIATIHTDNWGAAPAAASGDLWRPGDLDGMLVLQYDGANWVPIHDPWGIYHFFERSIISAADAVEHAAQNVLTTPADTALRAGTTWTITESVGEIDAGATNGANIVEYDLAGARSHVFMMIGLHVGIGNAGIYFQSNADVAATEIDDAYMFQIQAAGFKLWIESAGLTELADSEQWEVTPDAEDPNFLMAFDYVDGTGVLTGYVRLAGQWIQVVTITDSTFTTMERVGLRMAASANDLMRVNTPFLVMSDA